MATPAFRSAGTWSFTATNVSTPTTLTPGAPAGKAVGDLLLLVCESSSITATVATPTGWTLVTGFPVRSGTASGGTVYLFSRIADGTATDTPSPVWSGLTTGTSGDGSGAGILAYTGMTATVDGAVHSTDAGTQTTTSTIPASTNAQNNGLFIGIALKKTELSGQTATVATFTESSDNNTTSGLGHILETSHLIQTTAGSSGTATVTWSNTTSARALTISIGFKSIMPTGAAARSETITLVAAGVRKALGAAARSETLTLAAAGVRKALGAAARSETVTFHAAGNASKVGAAARSLTISLVAAGVRKTFGIAARSETLTLVAAGVRSTFGAAARSETLTIAAAGVRKTFGVAARAETITLTAAGIRTRLGAASEPLSLSLTAAGVVTTPQVTGASAFPLTFSATAAGARTVLGAAVMSTTITNHASGTRTARGAAALSLTLGRTASGTRTTFGAAALGESDTLHAAGVRGAVGAASRPETITFVASAANIGAAAFGLTFHSSVTSSKRVTFGAAHLVILDVVLRVNPTHAGTFGAAAMPLSLPLHASGHTVKQGAATLPLVLTLVVASFNEVIGGPMDEGQLSTFLPRPDLAVERRGDVSGGDAGRIADAVGGSLT